MFRSASSNRSRNSGSNPGRAVNMQWLNGGDVQISTSAPSGASRSARTRSQNGLPIAAASARPSRTARVASTSLVPGVAVLADVAVETQRAIGLAFDQPLRFEEMNRQDRGVPAVAAAERQCASFEIGQFRDWAAGDGDDLRHPAEVGVAHRDRRALALAPFGRLKESEIRVPADVDAGARIGGRG